jgi:hypothetical protein
LECCFTWHCRPGRDDAKAADALYWATRLEPTWADAYYARRIAMHLGDPQRLRRYWLGDQGTIESGDIRRIDSLYYRARTIDPFVSQRLERRLFEAVADEIAKEHAGDPAQVRVIVEQEMNSWPGANRAWHAYIDGRSIEAVQLYADAIKADRNNRSARLATHHSARSASPGSTSVARRDCRLERVSGGSDRQFMESPCPMATPMKSIQDGPRYSPTVRHRTNTGRAESNAFGDVCI